MKRTELRRKTPLTAKTPLTSKQPTLTRSRRLRAVSTRQAAGLVEYRARRAYFMAAHPICQRCGVAASTDLHHRRGRVGADLVDPQHWAALCSPCHRHITEHPAEALAAGWSEPRIGRGGAA